MKEKSIFLKEYKGMIFIMILVIFILVPLKIFDLFDLSTKFKDILELFSMLFTIYQADKSKQGSKKVEQIKTETKDEVLKLEKHKKLYIDLSRNLKKINSYISKSIVFFDSDINNISLSKGALNNIQKLVCYLRYYEDILDDSIVNSCDVIIKLIEEYIEIKNNNKKISNLDFQSALEIKKELLFIKINMESII